MNRFRKTFDGMDLLVNIGKGSQRKVFGNFLAATGVLMKLFGYVSFGGATDVRSGDVQQPCSFTGSGEGGDSLGASYVHSEGLVDWSIKGNNCRAIDDDIDLIAETFYVLSGKAKIDLA